MMQSNRWKEFGEYFTWIAFISVLLVFTNGFASLDKILAYNFNPLSVFLTYGFILFCTFIKSFALAGLLVVIESIAFKFFGINLALFFRVLLFIALILALVLILVFIFALWLAPR